MTTQNRVILHSDLNAFYASVEIRNNPTLKGKPVVVCGNQSERRGIVLAKSEEAKRFGIKTGMANFEARKLCQDLIEVAPHYSEYKKYSKQVKEIYMRYSDLVESFGLDECWVDVSGCYGLFGDGVDISKRIKDEIKNETGLTVSIGVSFNKVFAKLGSDLKKPDAITEISKQNYKQKVFPLDVSELLYVGPATTKKFKRWGIHTIGDLANTSPQLLKQLLGVNGVMLWRFANGQDDARVMPSWFKPVPKSIGHGSTCPKDILDNVEAFRVIEELAQDIGHKLLKNQLCAKAVQLSVKNNQFFTVQFQAPLDYETQSATIVAKKAMELLQSKYCWNAPIRAITVRVIDLVSDREPKQLSLFDDFERYQKQERLDKAVDNMREKYGKKSVVKAAVLKEQLLTEQSVCDVSMPGMMYI